MVSTSVAHARGKVFELTEKRDFLGAYRYLVSHGFSAEINPALWALLARRCSEMGIPDLACDLYRALWDIGVVSPDAALLLASEALRLNDLRSARALLTEVFGDDPDDTEARWMLARANSEISPNRALDLIGGNALSSVDNAILVIDILRREERLEDGLKIAMQGREKFPNDPRFSVRIARIYESLSDWPAALSTWEAVEDAEASTYFSARINQMRLLMRLERNEAANEIAAGLLSGDFNLGDKLQLAATLGSIGLLSSILQTEFLAWRRNSDAVDDWDKICEILLDLGMVGALIWLRARGVPVKSVIASVIEIGIPEQERQQIAVAPFTFAKQQNAPQIFLKDLPSQKHALRQPTTAPETVLIINSTLAAGGAERQLLALCTALIEVGYQASQIHLGFFSLSVDRGHAHFLDELTALGITIHRLADFDVDDCDLPEIDQAQIAMFPRQLRSDIIQVTGLVQRIQPTVLHGWQDRSALACGWVGLKNNTRRIILSARNMQPQKRGAKQHFAAPLLKTYSQHRAVVITANALVCAKDYETWLGLPAGSIQTLRNGLRTENFKGVRDRHKRDKRSHEITIGGVFRLAANKRPLLWLRTVAALNEISPLTIKARLIGRGPFRDDVLALAEELNFDGLETADSLRGADEIYGSMDVLLLMSRVEGLPNVVLESHAAGLPVAACDVGGVNEALCQTPASSGLLLPSDPNAQTAARLLNDWLSDAINASEETRQDFIEKRFGLAALGQAAKHLYQGGQNTP